MTIDLNLTIEGIVKEKDVQPKIISDTIPIFIQAENGMWIKNPEYVECNN